MACVGEESYDRRALGIARPSMNANLWNEGLLWPGLVCKMRCLRKGDLCVHRSAEQEVACVGEESYDRHTLGIARPSMNANLLNEGLLWPGLVCKMRCLREGWMHRPAMEDRQFLPHSSMFGLAILQGTEGSGSSSSSSWAWISSSSSMPSRNLTWWSPSQAAHGPM